ncbi:SfnB family sulfur acquisition oxidoreductase [Lampropedia puyangensis]|uniref:SfnB family sulfur acquisition oxidoreductase n=1 Tax=Lampropedia puyangensis TaxID=1330072 RepID=A0A4S8F101_9BURK|nr:SfnB family sulfur acquisition oxidoreductase [Lampropedia puyangensis]THT99944.1 SfnB family sulfur acquisition oxidoreductase [Lampropedia puyangensis]
MSYSDAQGTLHASSSGTAQNRLPLAPTQPHRIATEAEALAIAADLARHFAQGAAQRDRERRLPWDELERYTASGLGAITIPRAYGGLGASFETLAQVFVTLCAADPSLGQIPQNHFALIQNLRDNATPAQQQRWFADVLSGHRLGNAGPEKKAKAANIAVPTARLHRDAQGQLRVSGSRFYSTGALFAHWVPFRAVDEQERFVQVWVRRDAPGVTITDDWDAFGQRTTASGSVRLEQVAVEPEDVVAMHLSPNPINLSGPISQLIQASIDQGIAQGALADAKQYVREKTRAWVHSGVDNAWEDPYIIQEFGQLTTEVDAAREVLLQAARVIDGFDPHPVTEAISAEASVAVARAKILTTEAALHASERMLELAGTSSAREAHNFDRHWRNARVHTLHDPVRWKYHLLGNHLLNGAAPQRHQWN